ncbi:aerotolerance regulator BatB [Porphyromonas macacae]|uniref:Aerotolerance regulator BatB n=1 Tax=Porphyromonas macacae TaxID=28115 RepID=A0A0A2E4T5_9PORP|nr:VWA domain-containing protein [Porphyromonas macacae]KGN72455.1 aerotolerance regulator BatB [Porphyromonas macacae]
MKLHFQNPEILYWLLIILPMIAIWYYAYYQRRKQQRRFAEVKMLRLLKPEASSKRRLYRGVLMITATFFLIIVLARPQIPGGPQVPEDQKGIEAMVCLDISNSMLSQDLAPDRLSFSKQILNRLFDEMAGNKVGLIVFAGNAYTQIPITTDLSAAKEMISGIDPEMLTAQGTSIGAAIQMASKAFSDNREIGKTIIVITDGENHEDDAVSQSKDAAREGIQVNVVGVGSPEGGPIPVDDGYMKDEEGKVVITKFNESMCNEIAQNGNGIVITGTNASAIANRLLKQLDKLPKANVSKSGISGYIELFDRFAKIALILLIVELFIEERKSRFLRKLNLFKDETKEYK